MEIEFADKSAGRTQRFMDSWNFFMGSLSPTGEITIPLSTLALLLAPCGAA